MNSFFPDIATRPRSSTDQVAIDAYVSALRETNKKEKTEHTDRHALKHLLESMSPAGITIVNEPKRVPGKGAPDFKVRQNGQIVGYVETKPIGTNLTQVLKSDQLEKYRALSRNILVTDYTQWAWLRDSTVKKVSLCDTEDIFASKMKLNDDRVADLAALLRAFASSAPQKISSANVLADELAVRSRFLRDFLGEELKRQEVHGQGERLYGLYNAFKQQVSETIKLPEFADAFAQTLSYGLFLSKLNANGHSLGLQNAKQYIPKSFKLIQELVGFLDVLEVEYYNDVRWVVDEILSVINGLDVKVIKESLSFKNRKGAYRNLRCSNEEEWRLFSRDPFIYFYEDFLTQYDTELRKRRGVYYTPPPVVNFIVRATDDVLKARFGLQDGLADHKSVTVLDFACGTGTFIIELIERIIGGVSSSAKVELLLKEHVLKNICAFEYLIAPYTIAHLKLSQYLEDRQIKIADEKFNILLTNTLEPLEPQRNYLLPALSDETRRALEIKKNGVLVITGNPPYAGHSQNTGKWITSEVRRYREGVPELNKPGQGKWLQNDYVKFIRFAQYEMDRKPEGLVAIITDNSYLDNPTFRGMRHSLMGSFDQIYIVDLHGNANKKERAPDGSEDENVFDIKQGVAVAFLIKRPGLPKGVWKSDVWGKRIDKYKLLADADFSTIKWEQLTPSAPVYTFATVRTVGAKLYNDLWSMPQIFSPIGDPAPGIVTTQDQFAISFTAEEAVAKVNRLLATRSESEARKLFRLCRQSQWNYSDAKKNLKGLNLADLATSVLYQPFDKRWTIWNKHVAVHLRTRAMDHMRRGNVAISLIRKADIQGEWQHVLVADEVTTHHTVSMKEVNYVFPLYVYRPKENGSDLIDTLPEKKQENLSPKFRQWIDKRYGRHFSPEAIMGFIYAILHSRRYREKYRDLLRMDFPRIPFPKEARNFEVLSELGCDLMKKHLLKSVPKLGMGVYHGNGGNAVSKVRYVSDNERLEINGGQYFAPIPRDVAEFKIGGYPVLLKYLKSRKGKELTLDEIDNVEKVTNVLAFTIEQMRRIDEVYAGAA